MYSTEQKGYETRICLAQPDPQSPLETIAVWGAIDAAHVVARQPPFPHAFVEFFYTLTGLSWAQAQGDMAADLHAVIVSVLQQQHIPVTSVTVFAVRDSSSAKSAQVNFSVQLRVPRGKVRSVRAFVVKGDAVVSGELAARYASKYPMLSSFRLGGIPVVVVSALPVGLRVLVWSVLVLVVGCVGTLCVLYRRAIGRSVVWVMEEYRNGRRRRQGEEMGIPLNMTYLPKENTVNRDAMSFETPYGDIHLVTPLITVKNDQEMEGFCQAAAIVQ